MNKALFFRAFVFLLFFLSNLKLADAKNEWKEGLYSLAVAIQYKGEYLGSGFFYCNNENVYFVTAKHVLKNCLKSPEKNNLTSENLLQIFQYSKLNEKNTLLLNVDYLQFLKKIKFHDKRDVAVIEIAKIGKNEFQNLGNGDVQGSLKYSDAVIVDGSIISIFPKNIYKIDNISPGEELLTFGYPTTIGLKEKPQINYDRPLVRQGVVAQIDTEQKRIVIDTSVYFGNSGSPTIFIHTLGLGGFYVIGIVVEFIPFAWSKERLENSGYAVVEPVDFILEVIDSFGEEEKNREQIFEFLLDAMFSNAFILNY